jgi:methylenetetrahydrofolate reductase (NADPH)
VQITERIKHYKEQNKTFFSFEFFPPKTEGGNQNLYARLDRMAAFEPCFIDITWGAGGSTSAASLNLAKNIQQFFGLDVLLHLTCINQTEKDLIHILDSAQQAGIKNILALRGDKPKFAGTTPTFLNSSIELIQWIRKRYGDQFCIGVGGYPESHPEAKDLVQCTQYLKQKLDAGASFVLTQLFYDMQAYEKFLELTVRCGIKDPIVPGIMPIMSFERFKRLIEISHLEVPKGVRSSLDQIKDDDEKVQAYGIRLATDLSQQVLKLGSPGLHFYTLNLESSVTQVLQNLHLLDDTHTRKQMPWRTATVDTRKEEDVRPIFWSNRPKSYLARTMTWDDFPNGRWGNNFSPTFGDLSDHYIFRRTIDEATRKSRFSMWGHPKSDSDVFKIFADYCRGSIPWLPWCETSIQPETHRIVHRLVDLNLKGYLTINSQPQVNGAASDSSDIGWGGPGGFIFQKAYLEFFCDQTRFFDLLNRFKDHPTLSFHATNSKGETYSSNQNASKKTVNAVTWGVFPNKEIIQPTVVDSDSFQIWKDEAFQLWLHDWQSLYEKESTSHALIQNIYDQYFLVNIVENDFIHGDIYKIFSL